MITTARHCDGIAGLSFTANAEFVMLDPNNINDVKKAMDIVAQLAAENAAYLPIFESFERDYDMMKSGGTSQARAMRIARRRKEIAALI